ncbi:MAG: PD40 domain-containing protein [Myxococcales bacterium]|nr:PD40 domain-containing protein [Myxococcales bacterium]
MRAAADPTRAPATKAVCRLAWLLCAIALTACATGNVGETEGRDAATRDDADRGRDVRGGVDASADGSGEDAELDVAPMDGSDDSVDVEPPPRFVALTIEPDTVVLATALGVPTSATLQVWGEAPDGTRSDVTSEVEWHSTSLTRARVDAGGLLSASGNVPGEATVSAVLDPWRAEAHVEISIAALEVEEGVDPTEVGAFGLGGSGGPDAPAWANPEDGVVYPAGIAPPMLQWRSVAGLHRVSARTEYARIERYTRATSWTPSAEAWALLTADPTAMVTVELSVAPGAGLATSEAAPLHIQLADASLQGSVYYWQIRTGDIMEIPTDEPSARPLFPNNAESGTCRGCHAITRDGGRIGFMYNGGDNPRAGIAWVGAPDPPVVENGTTFQWDSLSFDPAGVRAAAVFGGRMWLADTTPGLAGGIARLGDIDAANAGDRRVTHPAWSPDGTTIAFIERDPGGSDWDFRWGNLWTVSWDAATETFGDARLLIANDGGERDTLSYPTWTPDSRWLAYSVGPSNRGDAPATLWLADPLTGDRTQLVRGAPNGDSVLPAFSPFREGGYYWLLFYSSRPYGDVTTEKQLWVMAVDVAHVPGIDPSHAAFWLPGQNVREGNITGYWARSGCLAGGEACKTDDDCCVGLRCMADEGSVDATCRPVECVLPGRPCATTDVCCPGYECATSLLGTDVCVERYE